MNSKKRTIGIPFFLLVVFMMLTLTVYAQNASDRQRKTPEDRAQIQSTWMLKNLNLDSLQAEKVQVINQRYAWKNEPILASGASNLSKFNKLKSLQNEKDAELKKIFTPEQFKQYELHKEELKENIKAKRNQN